MKKIGRTLAFISAALSSLTLIPTLKGIPGTLRTIGGALSPVLNVMGTAGAALGVASRDPVAAVAGTVGAANSATYIWQNTRPHDGMRQAFGPRWYAGIPVEVRQAWLRDRWTPLPLRPDQWARRECDIAFTPSLPNGGPTLLDVWSPAAGVTSSGVGIVMLHGGAWHYGRKGDIPFTMLNYLAGQGHTIVDVDYRMPPQGYFFHQMADVKRAVAWVKRNLEVDRVVLYGFSAGAHLALLAGYAPHHPQLTTPDLTGLDLSVDGVVAMYPPADFEIFVRDWVLHGDERFEETWFYRNVKPILTPFLRWQGTLPEEGELVYIGEVLKNYLGSSPLDNRTIYDLASPMMHVDHHAPPTLLLHGEDDQLVVLKHSENLAHRLRDYDVPVVMNTFPRTGHGFDHVAYPINTAARSALYDIERFLAHIAYC